jgi:hypothetical protein
MSPSQNKEVPEMRRWGEMWKMVAEVMLWHIAGTH